MQFRFGHEMQFQFGQVMKYLITYLIQVYRFGIAAIYLVKYEFINFIFINNKKLGEILCSQLAQHFHNKS